MILGKCRMCGTECEVKSDGLCLECYYALKDEYEQEEMDSLMEEDRRWCREWYGVECEEVER